jgi:hypothetical protein
VVSSVLRLLSILCIGAIVLSFAAFASDEAGDGSEETVARIGYADAGQAAALPTETLNQPSPPPRVERVREKEHAGWREAIDDVNDVVTNPFTTLAADGSIWAQRIVTGLLALALFGFGLSFVARVVALRGW